MKQETLISMVEFTKAQHENLVDEVDCMEFHHSVYNYSQFLSTPLTLKMFVPCDLEGTILNEEYLHDVIMEKERDKFSIHCEEQQILFENHCDKIYSDIFQQAESRVLFEGFTHIEKVNGYMSKVVNSINDRSSIYIYDISKDFCSSIGGSTIKTIEDLVPYKLKLKNNN